MNALLDLALVTLFSVTACAAAECRAVVIGGDPGNEPAWADDFSRWTGAWTTQLETRCGIPAANVRQLSCPAAAQRNAVRPETLATRENAIRALDELARSCSPEDQAIVVLIGHGYEDEGVAKLCLPGADLADADVVRALAPLRARACVIIVLAPEGATWAKALTAPRHAVVVGNVKQSAPYFGEFLLRALGPEVSLLDAFNAASFATIAWYQNQFEDAKTHLITVHGKANQDLYRLVYPGREFQAGDEKPRAAINDLAQHDAYEGRRVLAEIAGMDDDGDGTLSSVFEAGKEPKPLGGGADGKLAGTLILGRP